MWLQLVSYALFRAFFHFRRAQAMTWKMSRVCWQTVALSITVLQKRYQLRQRQGYPFQRTLILAQVIRALPKISVFIGQAQCQGTLAYQYRDGQSFKKSCKHEYRLVSHPKRG
ncbi:hypothetical protein B0H14DRAFT_2739117 [Mycena olivaceomarginata]|nr:hypothetical protein B0H14DRAFT_2739117 [Mycena olivaceomarginata]